MVHRKHPLPMFTRGGVVALLLILGAAGAKGAPQESGPVSLQTSSADVAGTYALATVNGNNLPYTLTPEPGAPSVSITAGTFTIKPDGTCSSKMAFVLPSGEAAGNEVSGTYTREGAKLIIQWQGAGRTTGTVKGDTFTMDNEGVLFAYRKTV